MQRLLVVGSGGHARSVLEAARAAGRFSIVGLIDDFQRAGTPALGSRILGGVDDAVAICAEARADCVFVAIGDNFRREAVASRIKSLVSHVPFATIIHPSATVASDATVGMGTVLMPHAIVGAGSTIGDGCVLNTRSGLDHDCAMSNWSSLAPGAVTGGSVRIGTRSFVGLGASVIDHITIGEDTVIGAGALVLDNFGDRVLAYGSPCRRIRERVPDEAYF